MYTIAQADYITQQPPLSFKLICFCFSWVIAGIFLERRKEDENNLLVLS